MRKTLALTTALLGASALFALVREVPAAWPIADDEKAVEKSVPAPKISVEPAAFDFGKALPGKTLEKQFSIRNFGDADLVIEGISTTCGCTAGLMDDAHKVLKPGASGQLRVRLETREYSGKLVRSVLVRSNDPETKLLEVKVEVMVQSRGESSRPSN
jgi:hypothetical protein